MCGQYLDPDFSNLRKETHENLKLDHLQVIWWEGIQLFFGVLKLLQLCLVYWKRCAHVTWHLCRKKIKVWCLFQNDAGMKVDGAIYETRLTTECSLSERGHAYLRVSAIVLSIIVLFISEVLSVFKKQNHILRSSWGRRDKAGNWEKKKMSFSARRPQKYVDHFSCTADWGEKHILTGEGEDSSEWDPTTLTFGRDTCERSRDWKIDDLCLLASHPMMQKLAASTEFGQRTLVDKQDSFWRTTHTYDIDGRASEAWWKWK